MYMDGGTFQIAQETYRDISNCPGHKPLAVQVVYVTVWQKTIEITWEGRNILSCAVRSSGNMLREIHCLKKQFGADIYEKWSQLFNCSVWARAGFIMTYLGKEKRPVQWLGTVLCCYWLCWQCPQIGLYCTLLLFTLFCTLVLFEDIAHNVGMRIAHIVWLPI